MTMIRSRNLLAAAFIGMMLAAGPSVAAPDIGKPASQAAQPGQAAA